MRALMSVWDKAGLVDLARGLRELGVEIVASGGTAAALEAAGVAHLDVADVTGLPRDARRAASRPCTRRSTPGSWPTAHEPDHMAATRGRRHRADRPGGLQPLPLHLGPVGRADRHRRSHHGPRRGQEPRARRRGRQTRRSTTGCWPSSREHGDAVRRDAPRRSRARPSRTPRLRRADRALARHRRGDRRGARASRGGPAGDAAPRPRARRGRCATARTPTRSARATAWLAPRRGGTASSSSPGRALSYLNLFDADAAWRLVHELAGDAPGLSAVAIIKHANAVGAPRSRRRSPTPSPGALGADPVSAFGGVVAVARTRSTRTWPR